MSSLVSKMSACERQKILVEWNQTYSDYPRHKIIPEIFEEIAYNHFDQIALIFESQVLNYEALNIQANQLAHYLRTLGIARNDLIGVCLEPSFNLLVTILGILKAGGAYLPLDPHSPEERQHNIIYDAKAKIILTEELHAEKFQASTIQCVCLNFQAEEIAKQVKTNPQWINYANDLAYVIYTSGSTGRPKGVMITHKNIHHFTHWFMQALQISANDVFDFSSSISFDFSVSNTLFPLLIGSKIAICPEGNKHDPYLYFQHLAKHNVTITKLTPSYFRPFKEVILNENKNLNLKYIIFGGEILYAKDIVNWLKTFPQQIMFCEYGPTETTVATSWIKINSNNIDNYTHTIPIGKPALNTQLYVLDDELEPVAIRTIGELYIGGEGVAAGYLHQKDLTIKKFIPNPFVNDPTAKLYRTGDLCRLLPDGNIEFVGRKDHQIKIRGYRVEMQEIEKYLRQFNGIQDTIVSVRKIQLDGVEENQLIAYFTATKKIDLMQLRQSLLNVLPDYMLPAHFIELQTFPLLANGKLDRKRLPIPKKFHVELIADECSIKDVLTIIFCETLNLQSIHPDDNFFNLGGHSLLAARIITKIKSKLQKEISLKDFYDHATINSLAKIVDQAHKSSHTNFSTVQTKSHYLPLTDLQFLFWLMRLFYTESRLLNIVGRKRLAGKLNLPTLEHALWLVCQKHPILAYRIKQYRPIQSKQMITGVSIGVTDISQYSHTTQEALLLQSIDKLEMKQWKNHSPAFSLRAYLLADNQVELQFAISHFISDEVSGLIFLEELSSYYLQLITHKIPKIQGEEVFKEYIFQAKQHTEKMLNRDMLFWKEYLKQSARLHFPKTEVIQGNENATSYFHLTREVLANIKLFCSRNQLTIADVLCAAVSLVLGNFRDNMNNSLVLSVVKSARDNDVYDRVIGLFLRNDIIKITFDHSESCLNVAKKVQQSIAETAIYQNCPTIVKLAYSVQKDWKSSVSKFKMVNTIATVISKISKAAQLHPIVLSMFYHVSSALKKHNHFVNINIMNRFLGEPNHQQLFGLPVVKLPAIQKEKIVEKNIMNVWFDKALDGESQLILSANIHSDLRDKIGRQIVQILMNLNHVN